jgi:phage gpG-like protein
MKTFKDLISDLKKTHTDFVRFKSEASEKIGVNVSEDIKMNFEKVGLDRGKKGGFEKWEESNAARKRNNPSRPTLTDTSNLRDSIKYEVGTDLVKVGLNLSDAPYGKAHNEGKGKQLKRQFLFLKEELVEETIKETEKNFKKSIK